jgi:hypothetical protein
VIVAVYRYMFSRTSGTDFCLINFEIKDDPTVANKIETNTNTNINYLMVMRCRNTTSNLMSGFTAIQLITNSVKRQFENGYKAIQRS